MIVHYVLGFMFDTNANRVLLIRKARPAWQAGKLNGVGGKIEAGEVPVDALVREVEEEAGLSTAASQWRYFAVMEGQEFVVHCFETRSDVATRFQALTDEQLELVQVDLDHIGREGQRGLDRLVALALRPEEPFMRLV